MANLEEMDTHIQIQTEICIYIPASCSSNEIYVTQMRDASGLSALKRDQMGLVRKEAVDEKLYEDMMQQQNCPK